MNRFGVGLALGATAASVALQMTAGTTEHLVGDRLVWLAVVAGAPFLIEALRAAVLKRLVWQSVAVLASVAGIAVGRPLVAALIVCGCWLVQLRQPPQPLPGASEPSPDEGVVSPARSAE